MPKFIEIDIDTWSEIVNLEEIGMGLIGIEDKKTDPYEIVDAITKISRDIKSKKTKPPDNEIIAIAILLGWQYVRGLNWKWRELINPHDRDSEIIILSDSEDLYINPINWANDVLSSDRPVNFMLNYNMVAEKSFPPPTDGSALRIN